jgi:UTP--glucose-1-phosphate uridylyltransferase
VDKPIIQYVVEELVDAGVEDIIIVTGYHKRSIEDHFDYISADLRANLKQADKIDLLEQTKKISDLANFIYVRQKGPYGNATPILNSEHVIGNEPFIYAFADDFVKATPSRFSQLVEVYEQYGGGVLTCVKATKDQDYKRYGFAGGSTINDNLIDVNKIIEKPGSKEEAPSDFATVSGYIFEPEIFKYLKEDKENLPAGQEFIMQPAVQRMINDGHKIYGCVAKNGKYYDTGNKLEYLKTVVDFGLMHDELKDRFAEYLRGLNI